MNTNLATAVSTLEKTYGCPSVIAQKRSLGVRHLCPCCSNVLLRHARSNQVYWRCGHCYQTMPLLGDSVDFTI
ncbi:hypothetical protein E1H13_00415 [Nodosilinea sp. P-1105]|nr:hypothetical protein [Nodosilinea sp. P-1105]